MIYSFHVIEENIQKSLSFYKFEQIFKEEKPVNLNKDQADVWAASSRGSYLTNKQNIWLPFCMSFLSFKHFQFLM